MKNKANKVNSNQKIRNKINSNQPELENDDSFEFIVLINEEGQYSCIRSDWPFGAGWNEAGFRGTRRECAEWVEQVWKDMRPVSLREDSLKKKTGSLVVVYDEGAAAPNDIVAELKGVASLIFVIQNSEYARYRRPLLERFGIVIDGTLAEVAAEELAKYQPVGIVTFSERALRLTAFLAEKLNLLFHSISTVTQLTDKFTQRKAFSNAGIESIRFHLINRTDDWEKAVNAVGLPAVLKPSYGGGSINTFFIEDVCTGKSIVEELFAQEKLGFEANGALLLEEFLVGKVTAPFGDYVSVESAVINGVVEHIAITGKMPLSHPFREYGHFWPSTLGRDEQDEIYHLTTRSLQALGIMSGLIHTEIKLTENGPRIIEINGRVGGGINEMAKMSFNISLFAVAARIAMGQPVKLPQNYLSNDIFFNISHIAPTQPCEIVTITGEQELNEIPAISFYRSYIWPGSRLPGGTQTNEINIILGHVPDHNEFLNIYHLVGRTLRYQVRFPDNDNIVELDAHQLGAL